jgi:gliding motility-associated protein GldM
MGGGNNPRQKMIGIMYLVLIAMLALNIDTAVLEKFVLINQSFEVTNEEKELDNDRKLESITVAVDDSGNRTEDVAVLEDAQSLRSEARDLMSYMTLIKDSIANMTGGKDSQGKYIGYKDVDAVSRFMVKLGNGDSLQQKLNAYTELVRQVTEDTSIIDLARNADQIPIFELTASKHLPFKELNFGYNTPMVGGLASLSQLQNDLINLEIKALDNLAASVGAADLKFDVVSLTTLPDQKVVAAGAKYKAQLFLSAGSSAIVPVMTANGDTLEQ